MVINTDTDLKHFYSSIQHASLFYCKYFEDTLSPFIVKMMLEKSPLQRIQTAKDHLLWRGAADQVHVK